MHPAKLKYTEEQKSILVFDPKGLNSWGRMLSIYDFGKGNEDYQYARMNRLNNAIDKLKNDGKNE